jgi:hypothetical protein
LLVLGISLPPLIDLPAEFPTKLVISLVPVLVKPSLAFEKEPQVGNQASILRISDQLFACAEAVTYCDSEVAVGTPHIEAIFHIAKLF